VKTFGKQDEGATAPEYALMVGLITAVIAATVTTIGTTLNKLFTAAAGMFGAAS
jgi:pilus assembly protein Flp/PilA